MVFLKVVAHRCRTGEALLCCSIAIFPQKSKFHPHRLITAQLYGGDLHNRKRQGNCRSASAGLRVLEEARRDQADCSIISNEGHSAFLAIERIRRS